MAVHVLSNSPVLNVGKVRLADDGTIVSIDLGRFTLLRLARRGDRQEWAIGGPGHEHEFTDFGRALAALVKLHQTPGA
jgi:hypothetical protein